MFQLSLPVSACVNSSGAHENLDSEDAVGAQRSLHMQKYDRQMRLWGGHGQALLENSSVCALGSSAVVCETLKNLVLPSVGEIVVVDEGLVRETDLGLNFFLAEPLGQPKAQSAVENLVELNPDVRGRAENKSPEALLQQADLSWLDGFSLVIADANLLSEAARLRLAAKLWESKVPLLLVRSFGFLGSVRLQSPEVLVVESHPSNDRYDLRLFPPQLARFPELRAYLERFDPNAVSDAYDYAHIPYPAILHHLMKDFVREKGRLPASWDEKQEFKRLIQSHVMSSGEDEEKKEVPEEGAPPAVSGGINWDQACQFAYRVYTSAALDQLTQAVLEDPSASPELLGLGTAKFWFLVAALNRFREEHEGDLPLQRALPDLHTTSGQYAELKAIFDARARRDLLRVREILDGLLREAAQQENRGEGSDAEPRALVSDAELQHFLDHYRELRVVRTRPLAAEMSRENNAADASKCEVFNTAELREVLEEWVPEAEDQQGPAPPRNIHWYFGLRAADRFRSREGRWPGSSDESVEADRVLLQETAASLMSEWGLGDFEVDGNVVAELASVGGAENHNIAAVIGGVASQIALKVILQQYVPLNNTFIFNGIHGSGDVYQV